MSEEKQEPAYYAIIPAPVRYDDRLVPNAKLLYGEITCLTNKHGFCYATNKYFAELYKKDDKTISEWLKQLTTCGYVRSIVEKNYSRKLYVKQKGGVFRVSENSDRVGKNRKNLTGVSEKPDGGVSEKPDNNNTSINNKLNNTRLSSDSIESSDTPSEQINNNVKNSILVTEERKERKEKVPKKEKKDKLTPEQDFVATKAFQFMEDIVVKQGIEFDKFFIKKHIKAHWDLLEKSKYDFETYKNWYELYKKHSWYGKEPATPIKVFAASNNGLAKDFKPLNKITNTAHMSESDQRRALAKEKYLQEKSLAH